MVERSRIWRGPWRAPGRLVVPPSHGTPTMPISTSAGFLNSGRRMKVATSPKRGVTVPATGCGKLLEEESFTSCHPERTEGSLGDCDRRARRLSMRSFAALRTTEARGRRGYRYSLRPQKTLAGRDKFFDRRH